MKTEINNAVIISSQHHDPQFIARAIRDHNLWSNEIRITSYTFKKYSKSALVDIDPNSTIVLLADDPCAEDINWYLHATNNKALNNEMIFLWPAQYSILLLQMVKPNGAVQKPLVQKRNTFSMKLGVGDIIAQEQLL